jgi:signal peptidase I
MLIGFYGNVEMPLGINFNSDTDAPGNWIEEDQIHIYENIVVIDIEDASLSKYAPTGSMRPVLDKDSNGIRIIPESEEQIDVGDIITFEQDNQFIVHRVIEKGEDEKGVYFVTKGDNNNVTDGKIRFEDIRYVTIMMIW